MNYICDTFEHPAVICLSIKEDKEQKFPIMDLINELIDIESEIDSIVQKYRESLDEFIGSVDRIEAI